ncbi:peptidase S8/S53 domain-containing protein [Blastocladiella britannica]|nr:peptidase S8/S53 domain-containing protein [Blastocladiella britannica]
MRLLAFLGILTLCLTASVAVHADGNNQDAHPIPVTTDIAAAQSLYSDLLSADQVADAAETAARTLAGLLNLAAQGQNYIVVLNPNADVAQILDHHNWLAEKLLSLVGLGHVVHKYHLEPAVASSSTPSSEAGTAEVSSSGTGGAFYGYSGTFHPSIVQFLSGLPIVSVIEPDAIASIGQSTTLASTNTQTRTSWSLARISRKSRPNYNDPNQMTYTYNFRRGLGTEVYVLDTGIYTQHADFGGRAKTTTVPGVPQTGGDPNGHGTHVAGIIGSATFGVSKAASLFAVQVLGASGTGPWSNIIKGIEFVVQRRRASGKPTVINMSVTGTLSTSLDNALVAATNNNVHVVVAAGNEASETCKQSPGHLGGGTSAVIVVGSMGQSDSFSYFSNWGGCNDINAPGEFIDSLGTSGVTSRRTMSGTSMASPHVAGAVSLLLSQVPSWSPMQVKNYLKGLAPMAITNTRGSTSKMLYVAPRV